MRPTSPRNSIHHLTIEWAYCQKRWYNRLSVLAVVEPAVETPLVAEKLNEFRERLLFDCEGGVSGIEN